MSSTVYRSSYVRPENFNARHQRPEPLTLKGLGKRALQHVMSAGEQISMVASAKTKEIKEYASTQWHALFLEVPDNVWPVANAGRHTAASQGVPIAERTPVYNDISMLDLLMSEPYEQPRLEEIEHGFVDGMLTVCETTAAAGRIAVQRARQLVRAQ